jgi:hypothetical protein
MGIPQLLAAALVVPEEVNSVWGSKEDGEHHCFGYSVNVSTITSRRHREKNSGWVC